MKKKDKEKVEITTEQANEALEGGFSQAEELLKNESKFDEFMLNVENKVKTVPKMGGKLAQIPAFLSLLKSYIKKEYTKVPTATIVAVTSALLYFLLPSDLVPDFIPLVGYLDDASVISACLTMVGHDIKQFTKWRDKNKK
ncbi:MAG: DUF1232 domain-containing protein [Clostridia bacterium]|nr:DUF1232 domain-containing protein [Clostridia bacterium]